ncbi:MAG: hypothetical protein ACOYYU_04435 [Chloroflexota bacterium]
MTGPKDRKESEAGYQPQKTTNEPSAIKGYQPKGKLTEKELNPPTGESNVSQGNSTPLSENQGISTNE